MNLLFIQHLSGYWTVKVTVKSADNRHERNAPHCSCSSHFLVALLIFSPRTWVLSAETGNMWSLGQCHRWLFTENIYCKIGVTWILCFYILVCLFFLIHRTEEEILQLQLYHARDIAVSCWGKIYSICVYQGKKYITTVFVPVFWKI